jgi:hypothetical protein
MPEQKQQQSQQPFPWFEDTDPKALAALIECQRRMTAGEKLARVFALNARLRSAIEANVRQQYPNASEREVFLRATARRIGNDLTRRTYGWSPDES